MSDNNTASTIFTTGVLGLVVAATVVVVVGFSCRKKSKSNKIDEDDEAANWYLDEYPPKDATYTLIYNSKYKIRYTDDTRECGIDPSKPNKTTLILVHGFLGCLETWNKVKKRLLSTNESNKEDNNVGRIITLDLLGNGFSDKPFDSEDFEYTFESQGMALAEFIKEMDVLPTNGGSSSSSKSTNKNKLVLVGHSAGGMIICTAAKQLLHKYNIHIDGLIMIAPGFFNNKPSFLSNPYLTFLAKKILAKFIYIHV